MLKGVLRKPRGVARPPVVVMCMGLDSTKEEMRTNEEVFLDRGMATFAFDGPGQGEAEYDLPIRPDYEAPVAAVIDALEARDDIDTGRLGLWGVSLGGYYAPRAAAFEPRVRACVSLTGPFDFADAFARAPELTRAAFIARCHARDADEAAEVAARMTLDGVAERIRCPIYVVGGRLDRVVPPEHAERLARSVVRAVGAEHGRGRHACREQPPLQVPPPVGRLDGRPARGRRMTAQHPDIRGLTTYANDCIVARGGEARHPPPAPQIPEDPMNRALRPNILQPADLDPQWRWEGRLPAWGHTSVDFERRVDLDRLRRYRLARAARGAEGVATAARCCCSTSTTSATSPAPRSASGSATRCAASALLAGDGEPIVWDFGSAADAPPAVLRLARAGELPRRHARHARHGPARRSA